MSLTYTPLTSWTLLHLTLLPRAIGRATGVVPRPGLSALSLGLAHGCAATPLGGLLLLLLWGHMLTSLLALEGAVPHPRFKAWLRGVARAMLPTHLFYMRSSEV